MAENARASLLEKIDAFSKISPYFLPVFSPTVKLEVTVLNPSQGKINKIDRFKNEISDS
jgi:hypothetical protein